MPVLAHMTIYDYIRTMRQAAHTRVQVAELKARLSEYLRKAQSGEEVLVLSRDTAVAMLDRPRRAKPPSCWSGAPTWKALRPSHPGAVPSEPAPGRGYCRDPPLRERGER